MNIHKTYNMKYINRAGLADYAFKRQRATEDMFASGSGGNNNKRRRQDSESESGTNTQLKQRNLRYDTLHYGVCKTVRSR